jgi:hypothetical protein
MSRRALLLPAVLLLGCTFVAAARAAFGIAVAPATVTASAVTLSGVDQVSSFTATITVSGAVNTGWNITAWAPIPTSGANTLAALVVPSQPTLGACSGGSCSLPTPIGITWPVGVGTTAGAATKIYNADVSTGKGTNTVTVTFNIPVPARSLPGSYTTTLTITGSASGP